MAVKFSPSINILRDINQEINYIPTPNSKGVFYQIVSNYQAGHHSFNIIGAYGTGKSAFIWALEKTLNKTHGFFSFPENADLERGENEFVYLIGNYSSFIETLAVQFIPNSLDYTVSEVIHGIDEHRLNLQKQGKRLLFVIDEFGKFLEYAAKNNPEQELYFIQQLAEYVNDKAKDVLLITVMHQDFSAYAHELTRSQKEEWTKVKGRLKELTFNEPVEQLLFLASKRLASSEKEINAAALEKLMEAISKANAFPLNDYFSKEIARDVYPIDILAAAVLTLAMQKYGQNERSLFTFLESDDQFGLGTISNNSNAFFSLRNVYDYLSHHFYNLLRSKHNPHFGQWASLKSALERADAFIEGRTEDARSILKALGLLTIFTNEGAQFDKSFLATYGKLALGIENPEQVIDKLVEHKIIRFAKHRNRFFLFEGTDLDIELAVDEAGQLVEHVTDVVKYLKQYFVFPYVQAKQVSYEKGTPRIFEFKLTNEPILENPQLEIDGFINLVFNDKIGIEDVKAAVGDNKEAILYGLYSNTTEIKSLIREIEKIKKVKELNPNDKVAQRDLEELLTDQIALLNRYVLGSIYSNEGKIKWFFNGEADINFNNRSSFNRSLSDICNEVYPDTPSFKSELVNKSKLTGAISGARKNYVRALVENWGVKDLDFNSKQFPPEKTIYLSLLKNTGIHTFSENGFILSAPTDATFKGIWERCVQFLKDTRLGERNLSELINILLSKPLKVKQGFIDFWLPTFLFINRHQFALFGPGGFIADLDAEVLNQVARNPNLYTIKAFDVEGERLSFFNQYRDIIQKAPTESPSKETFIETIKPFLVFYKSLPEYTKKTKKLEKNTLSLRSTIAKIKDPEAAFFDDFPQALGYSLPLMQQNAAMQEEYIEALRASMAELRDAYKKFVSRLEEYIVSKVVGTEPELGLYKAALQKRFENLKGHQLESKQKAFVQRLNSKLDDRDSWLNSIATALVQKPLSSFDDADEELFYQHFQKTIYSLDRLTDLANANVDVEREEAFKIEINSFEGGLQQQVIRYPRNQTEQLQNVVAEMQLKLNGLDRQQSIAVLTNLLKEQLKDE
ncbi:hypothetical protein MKJ04_09125 [Pontibacter sp. E15-1]|uniref:hypothetical protein n=1 Tax=Pontibacter sp. E15-1 TaxID=2919918 RepID=UPI001F4FE805|nr:hypothetical protein [Pontibacter sp. E15-1]MCJ8165005.1 hypothetical protein [Pontibacter sp. E15-1]